MKRTFLAAMAFCCLAIAMLTSCLNDDNEYSPITPEEKATAFNAIKGTYKGSLIYPSVNANDPTDTKDTLQTTWEINNDSTILIRNFPIELLATNITNENLAEALRSVLPRDIKCHITFNQVSPVMFFVNPDAQTFALDYSDKTHVVTVAMMSNNIYSVGSYDATEKTMQMQIVESGIYVNGILQSNMLSEAVGFAFKGTKQ